MAAGAVATFGFQGANWGTWRESGRWNMFALRESGLGRMASRAMTKDADTSWHHGLLAPNQVQTSNAVSRWIDQGVVSLGFQGRLAYRAPSEFPIRPFEVREVLAKTEKNLSTAFTLDPGNYEAYEAYVMFLTTQLRETEFGSMDERKEESDASPKAEGGDQADSQSDDDHDLATVQRFRKWKEQEQRRRNLRAISITDYAISRFASEETDPERHLGQAMTYYDRFALLAPDAASRKSSFFARRLFETQALQTVEKMKVRLNSAKVRQQAMMASGVWQNRSEGRLSDYRQDEQMVERYVQGIYESLVSNRGLDGVIPVKQALASVDR